MLSYVLERKIVAFSDRLVATRARIEPFLAGDLAPPAMSELRGRPIVFHNQHREPFLLPYGRVAPETAQSGLSVAYVLAVASVAGCVSAVENPDIGIDVRLRHEADFHTLADAGTDIQVKSTSLEFRDASGAPRYDLDVKNYNQLVKLALTPRILVVVFVPTLREEWLIHREDVTEIRRAAYWVSLAGRSPTTNKNTIRVTLPADQQFTVAGLLGIMERVGKYGTL